MLYRLEFLFAQLFACCLCVKYVKSFLTARQLKSFLAQNDCCVNVAGPCVTCKHHNRQHCFVDVSCVVLLQPLYLHTEAGPCLRQEGPSHGPHQHVGQSSPYMYIYDMLSSLLVRIKLDKLR